MAAIAGLLHADPEHPIDRDAADMQARRIVATSGGDIERWVSGAVHLVSTGPAASNLRVDHARFRIVGDVRLDGRAASAASLGLDPSHNSERRVGRRRLRAVGP